VLLSKIRKKIFDYMNIWVKQKEAAEEENASAEIFRINPIRQNKCLSLDI